MNLSGKLLIFGGVLSLIGISMFILQFERSEALYDKTPFCPAQEEIKRDPVVIYSTQECPLIEQPELYCPLNLVERMLPKDRPTSRAFVKVTRYDFSSSEPRVVGEFHMTQNAMYMEDVNFEELLQSLEQEEKNNYLEIIAFDSRSMQKTILWKSLKNTLSRLPIDKKRVILTCLEGRWVANGTKIQAMLWYLRNLINRVSPRILMFLDTDVYINLTFDVDGMFQSFASYGSTVVVSAERNRFPPSETPYPEVPPELNDDTVHGFKYLNSGSYIGYSWALAQMLELIHGDTENYEDQGKFAEYYLSHHYQVSEWNKDLGKDLSVPQTLAPLVKLDNLVKMWHTMWGVGPDLVSAGNTISGAYSQIFNRSVPIYHCNGWGTKKDCPWDKWLLSHGSTDPFIWEK